jgi:hypothetical protein
MTAAATARRSDRIANCSVRNAAVRRLLASSTSHRKAALCHDRGSRRPYAAMGVLSASI